MTTETARVFIVLLFICCVVSGVKGFASWMVNEFCDRHLISGEVIMNEVIVLSDDRVIRVHRSHFTESGMQVMEQVGVGEGDGRSGVFFPGEELTVSVSEQIGASSSTEYLFETSADGGRFLGERQGCGHTRTTKNHQVLTMPQFKTEVKVWVGELLARISMCVLSAGCVCRVVCRPGPSSTSEIC